MQEPLLSKFNITSMLLIAELVEHLGITSRYLAVDDGVPLPIIMRNLI
ncbi:hypothetical protein QUF54_01230 [Candidatus Marithioploca araucensis]|uniref:Uncharacterized protein n=1 Tax=Candidatus Marithioploca araucensis TaxID=70273 RepID=A0ABT7VQM6_9GAMM|nr:hypothetical protein [Candidatus Marithioploca araucensis]